VAVVPAETATVAVVPGVIEAGEIETVIPEALFAVNAIELFPLPLSVALTVNVTLLPVWTAPLLADSLSAKSTPLVVNGLPH